MPENLADEIRERLVRSAELSIPYLDKMYEVGQKRESDNAARIVWLLALLGFMVLNVSSIFGEGFRMPLLGFVSWLVTALTGVLAHWAHRAVDNSLMRFHSVRREQLLVYVVSGPQSATLERLRDIMDSTGSDVAKAKDELERATTLATRLELATFVLFVATLVLYGWYAVASAVQLPPSLYFLSPPSPVAIPTP